MNWNVLCWVRVERYCELTGEPQNTVLERIRDAKWAAGKHYKRTGPRTLWINLVEAEQWIASQPHVEAAPDPRTYRKASKSAQMAA